MKLIKMVCPQCGGTLGLPEDTKQIQCPFCNTNIILDDEVHHVQFDNSKQAGYEFEKGRIEAQQEHAAQQAQFYQNQAAIQAQQEAARKRKNLKWWILGWIFAFPIALTVLMVKTKRMTPVLKAILILALWIFVLFTGMVIASRQQADDKIIWNGTTAELDEFYYYVDGNSIVLKEHKGRDNKINIASAYEIDGKKYKVASLDGTFALDNAYSVIVPEGVKSMSDNVFNSCGLKYVYLPSTLKEFDGWNFFHNGEKLYYGGTEKQWKALFKGEREEIDFKQILFEAKIDDLLTENEKGK